MDLNDNIKALRELWENSNSLKMYHIAKKINISPSYLSELLNGKKTLSVDYYCKILDILGYEIIVKKKESDGNKMIESKDLKFEKSKDILAELGCNYLLEIIENINNKNDDKEIEDFKNNIIYVTNNCTEFCKELELNLNNIKGILPDIDNETDKNKILNEILDKTIDKINNQLESYSDEILADGLFKISYAYTKENKLIFFTNHFFDYETYFVEAEDIIFIKRDNIKYDNIKDLDQKIKIIIDKNIDRDIIFEEDLISLLSEQNTKGLTYDDMKYIYKVEYLKHELSKKMKQLLFVDENENLVFLENYSELFDEENVNKIKDVTMKSYSINRNVNAKLDICIFLMTNNHYLNTN